MAIILKVWCQIENPTLSSKKNNPAKFHPDPIRSDGALGIFEEYPNNKKNNNNKMSSDMRSVPGVKIGL